MALSRLREKVDEYFEVETDSPYILLVSPVQKSIRQIMIDDEKQLFDIDKLNIQRSTISAVTHVDYFMRMQTFHQVTNPYYCRFEEKIGIGALTNTQKNSCKCFMQAEMDGGFYTIQTTMV